MLNRPRSCVCDGRAKWAMSLLRSWLSYLRVTGSCFHLDNRLACPNYRLDYSFFYYWRDSSCLPLAFLNFILFGRCIFLFVLYDHDSHALVCAPRCADHFTFICLLTHARLLFISNHLSLHQCHLYHKLKPVRITQSLTTMPDNKVLAIIIEPI